MHKLIVAGIILMFMPVRGWTSRAQERPEPPRATTRGAAPAIEPGEPPRIPAGRSARGAFRPGGPGPSAAAAAASQPATEGAEQRPVVTEHQLTIDGRPLHYKATAGMIPLKDDAGRQVRGNIFYIAYEKTEPPPATSPTTASATSPAAAHDGDATPATSPTPTTRPVTFVFNGGPGAASIWLHLGTAGPKRVKIGSDGVPPAPPYSFEDNLNTWLAWTDLVFIDPIGTGYSRAEGDRGREFYGVRGDLDSVADFIRIYLTRYQRWGNAKFVIGESYGTTRAAGLSELLHERYGIDLNGIVLISTVLNFQTISFDPGNDSGYVLYLPSYAAVAHYHKKLPQDLQSRDVKTVVAEATRWAEGEYTQALLKGTSLTDDERRRIDQQLSRYTGLPLDYVAKANLRIAPFRFEKALLADQGKIIGRMDGRITAYDSDPLNDTPEFDPSLTGYVGLFSTAFNDYVRRELKYENEGVYEFLSPRVGQWDFGTEGRGGYLNVATTLRRCISKVPSTKVFVASGYYDFATPFTAADYTVNQMQLNRELRGNIRQGYYEGGHMLYLNRPGLEALTRDLREFFTWATKP
jgi:carboxypeptidase C (cathepsin A)